ncbi:MAG: hypothetical protein V1900_03455 [Candidatus Aenigmatarchaeota archaeon]
MKKIILILMLLLAVTFVCGCVANEGTTIKNQDQASSAVENVSSGVEKIGQILEDIDNKIS